MPLTITSEPGEGFVTIRPAGSLDSNTYTDLQEHIAAVTKSKPRVLVLDLKGLSYISSAGVRVVIVLVRSPECSKVRRSRILFHEGGLSPGPAPV